LQADGYATGHGWADQVSRIGDSFEAADGHPGAGSAHRSQLSGSQGNSVLDVAKTAIGSKYNWGGPGGRTNFDPKFVGSDCSGFVAWAYENATGVRLPAQTASIWATTQQISPEEAQPGDLIEFGHGQGPENEHVAI